MHNSTKFTIKEMVKEGRKYHQGKLLRVEPTNTCGTENLKKKIRRIPLKIPFINEVKMSKTSLVHFQRHTLDS